MPEWRIGASPITTIAGSETDTLYDFYNTGFITRLSDGRIVVAASGEHLRFYSSGGKYLLTAGRKGDGPGEFRQIAHMARLPGDTIATFDGSPGRVSFFNANGAFVDSYNVTGLGQLLTISDRGEFINGRNPRHPDDGPGKLRDRFELLGYDRAGMPRDTLGMLDGMWWLHDERRSVSLPFTPDPKLVADGNRIFVTEADVYEIRVFEDAKPLHLIRNLTPRYPVTDQDRKRITASGEGRDTSTAARAAREARAKNALEQHPAIRDLLADGTGNVWVLHEPPEDIGPPIWHVYGADGRLRARLHYSTDRGRILEIGDDYVVIVQQADMMLTRIEVLPLLKN